MGTRVGIELSPVACRLVELGGPSIKPGHPPATRVRSYAVLPPSGPDTDRRLAALGRRPAAVVVWGVRSDHRQIVVSNGSYEKMRTEALTAARSAGIDTRGVVADIATASTAIRGADRQPVVLALANADDVSAAVQPLLAAGVRVRSVITPADALLGLARSRRAFAVSGGIEAYVAMDETATCVALVRDGSLLSAHELPWGYADGTGAPAPSAAAEVPRRDDLAARLISELADFLAAVGADGTSMTQISICGGLPDLRTMTASLIERLDVEVETLDSLFGVDVEHLPEPQNEFRERASELRLAWAAAADWRGPINLMRHRRRRNRRVAVARAAVVAGAAAGLATGWAIQQSAWWQATTPQPVARRTPAATPPVTSPAPARATATPRPATPNVPAPTAPTAPTTSPPGPVPPAPTVTPAATPLPSNATVPARPPTLPSAPVGSAAAGGTTAAAPNAPVPSPVATLPPAMARPPAAAPPVARVTPPAAAPPVARVTPPAAAPPVARVTPPATPPPVARVTPPATPPPVARVTPPATAPPVARVTPPAATPSVARVTPPAAPPPVARPAPRQQPTPVPPATVAVAPPAAVAAPVAPRPAAPTPVPPATVAVAPPAAVVAPVAPRPAAPTPVPRRAEETPVPFDAVLGTILYSPDRKLAIVNGRIVGLGDVVNGARIVDITPGTVLLRDPQGRLRSLTLGADGRSGTAP